MSSASCREIEVDRLPLSAIILLADGLVRINHRYCRQSLYDDTVQLTMNTYTRVRLFTHLNC